MEVYSPAVDASYDFQMDEDMPAGEAARAVSEMIARKNGSETADEAKKEGCAAAAFYDTKRCRELDQGSSLKDNGVTSGRRLLLV